MTMSIIHASARRRSFVMPGPTATPSLTWTAAEQAIIPDDDTNYFAFPGAITCPNGDILAMSRNGQNHLGAGDLIAVRSSDGGATWGTPTVAVPRTATHGYGTATLSMIDATTIALVTWMRPLAGGHPPIDAVRIFLSTDSGATWGTPYIVETADWLTEYNVSESALIFHNGFYYLGVWGEALGNAQNHFIAGVVRSANLSTWHRVALFDSGAPEGFNEIGVVSVGGYLVALVRNETAYRWTSVSLNGASWTPRVSHDINGRTGAPKMAETFFDVALVPLRGSNGHGFVAGVDSSGGLYSIDSVLYATTGSFMYGQVVKLTPTTGGVVFAVDHSSSGYRAILWRPFAITPI